MEANKQQLLINTRRQKTTGDDSEFIIDLQQAYSCRRIVLDRFTMDNIMANFVDSDFSYMTSTGVSTIIINDIHLTLSQLMSYFNMNNVLQLTYKDPNLTYSKLQMSGSQTWYPIGDGWKRLGFVSQAYTLQLIQNADIYYNLQQSPVVYIRFNNIINSYNNGTDAASFTINNTSSFGSLLQYDASQTDLNQVINFGQQLSFNSLDITLLDVDYKKIRTTNSNHANMSITMSLSLY